MNKNLQKVLSLQKEFSNMDAEEARLFNEQYFDIGILVEFEKILDTAWKDSS